ncbi:hypothetical protein [Aureimonas glaciei]|uniref:Uncharacterized protein n=1 Tax=Aureimonas glaciei TaxID=1776957 RepID=A0A917DJQ7_9HYPH|nr:hypothetical protein [Aureimonas glaciei]GGD43146.1 hypothetical protein GCM10011335_52280 [Aureimonas glaciei]
MTHHPIRDLEIWTYLGTHGALAYFEDGNAFPTFFRGTTMAEARDKAEAFRAKVIAENEASFIARTEAAAKAAAKRAAKARAA